MSFRIDRTRRAVPTRRIGRASADADPAESAEDARLPVVVGPVTAPPRPEPPGGDAAFATQLMGQDGQKRGLRAGQTLLERAQKLYVSIEWSGARDRRARNGRRARTEV